MDITLGTDTVANDDTYPRFVDQPIDILGGGFVVAPPSKCEKGDYQLIVGTSTIERTSRQSMLVLDKLRSDSAQS